MTTTAALSRPQFSSERRSHERGEGGKKLTGPGGFETGKRGGKRGG